MKFKKLVCVDETKLNDSAIRELDRYAEQVEVYHDEPDRKEVIKRLINADAVIVSWKTRIDQEIIKNAPALKYIGMACTLFDADAANVEVTYARKQGITVKGIKDYGDPGVSEFIISELIQLLNGYKANQFRNLPQELTNLKIGIVGLGVTGQLLAECLLPFKPRLYYFSKTRKKEWEKKGLTFLNLEQLLATCDVISFHVPRDSIKMKSDHFKILGKGKILINTSLGLPFDDSVFKDWISEEGNYAIFDGDGGKELSEDIRDKENLVYQESSAGWSEQTQNRLSDKVITNIQRYLKKHS